MARPVFEKDGKFGFCLAEKIYADGRNLTFAYAPSDKINIGLMIPNAGFAMNRQYDLSLSLAQERAAESKPYERAIRAVAIDANSIVLQMGNNAAFAQALTNASQLSVEAAGKRLDYALPPMKSLLNDLKACIGENRNKKSQAVADAEQAMPETLKALLIESGLTNFKPMRMDDIPADRRPADFVWQTGALIGGVRERLAPTDKNFNEMIGLYVDGLKKKCTGAFNAELGREEKAGGLRIRKADVQCQMKAARAAEKEKKVAGAILFYMTASRRFTIFTHEGDASNQTEAAAIRDAIHKTITQLAKDSGSKP